MQFFYPASSIANASDSPNSLIRPTAAATILTMLSTIVFFVLTAQSGGHDHMYTAFVVLVPIEFYFFYVTTTFVLIIGGKLTGRRELQVRFVTALRPRDTGTHTCSNRTIERTTSVPFIRFNELSDDRSDDPNKEFVYARLCYG